MTEKVKENRSLLVTEISVITNMLHGQQHLISKTGLTQEEIRLHKVAFDALNDIVLLNKEREKFL